MLKIEEMLRNDNSNKRELLNFKSINYDLMQILKFQKALFQIFV